MDAGKYRRVTWTEPLIQRKPEGDAADFVIAR